MYVITYTLPATAGRKVWYSAALWNRSSTRNCTNPSLLYNILQPSRHR